PRSQVRSLPGPSGPKEPERTRDQRPRSANSSEIGVSARDHTTSSKVTGDHGMVSSAPLARSPLLEQEAEVATPRAELRSPFGSGGELFRPLNEDRGQPESRTICGQTVLRLPSRVQRAIGWSRSWFAVGIAIRPTIR